MRVCGQGAAGEDGEGGQADILRSATCELAVDHRFSKVFWKTYVEDIGGWIRIMGLRCLGK